MVLIGFYFGSWNSLVFGILIDFVLFYFIDYVGVGNG